MGNSSVECLENLKATKEILSKAGFMINEKKSVVEPSQQISFLGFVLNSTEMTVSLPNDKVEKIIKLCNEILSMEQICIRFLAEFIGVLVSSLPGVENGELYYRFLEKNRNHALKLNRGNYDKFTILDPEAKNEVNWWLCNISSAKKTIQKASPKKFLTTDASLLGWGAVCDETSIEGQWKLEEKELHINTLELKAIDFGLKSFFNSTEDTHIRIRSDNTTAVAYLNNKGGIRSIECHKVSKTIWEWAIERNLHLSAEHLPGSANILADKASRVFDHNTEWELDNKVFQNIIAKFGTANIDLFASRLNHKLKTYVSWKPDPCASFIDAFSLCWTDLEFYAFPPFSVILKTIVKVNRDLATGILVCPVWPTQPWFPKLSKMMIAPPLLLPQNCLFLPFNPTVRHKQNSLRLMACLLSGDPSRTEAFQKTLSISCVPPGDRARLSSMDYILKSGFISAVNAKLIPFHMI